MIISKEKNFIFTHVHRTGGTSFKLALGKYRVKTSNLIVASNKDFEEIKTHSTAAEIKELTDAMYGQDFFKNAFKFATVRNPLSWHISTYEFIISNPGHIKHNLYKKIGFKRYILDLYTRGVQMTGINYSPERIAMNKGNTDLLSRPDYITLTDYLCDKKGNLLMDHICRFETLQNDFNYVCKTIGISAVTIRHANKMNRKRKIKEYYDNDTMVAIYNIHKGDLEKFNYSFW